MVRIGDKEGSFVGSRQWIGSQEVSFVLSTLLDVDCRFIVLEKGSEILKYYRRLQDHFVSQGTPVMIGGGVLAFTCLGIQWKNDNSDCRFLILVVNGRLNDL